MFASEVKYFGREQKEKRKENLQRPENKWSQIWQRPESFRFNVSLYHDEVIDKDTNFAFFIYKSYVMLYIYLKKSQTDILMLSLKFPD